MQTSPGEEPWFKMRQSDIEKLKQSITATVMAQLSATSQVNVPHNSQGEAGTTHPSTAATGHRAFRSGSETGCPTQPYLPAEHNPAQIAHSASSVARHASVSTDALLSRPGIPYSAYRTGPVGAHSRGNGERDPAVFQHSPSVYARTAGIAECMPFSSTATASSSTPHIVNFSQERIVEADRLTIPQFIRKNLGEGMMKMIWLSQIKLVRPTSGTARYLEEIQKNKPEETLVQRN
ncbi:hypothetical protein B0H14DRAFT_3682860 [Mycena olivaceomarginata]|nr:hypothetical protein B0H14DRAFT_3682860 [Mycena olivaceomarginata]